MRMKIEGFVKDEHGFRHPVHTMFSPERLNKERYPKTNYHKRRLKEWLRKHYGATDFKLSWI